LHYRVKGKDEVRIDPFKLQFPYDASFDKEPYGEPTYSPLYFYQTEGDSVLHLAVKVTTSTESSHITRQHLSLLLKNGANVNLKNKYAFETLDNIVIETNWCLTKGGQDAYLLLAQLESDEDTCRRRSRCHSDRQRWLECVDEYSCQSIPIQASTRYFHERSLLVYLIDANICCLFRRGHDHENGQYFDRESHRHQLRST
jgi:hypothetical protein